MINAIDIASPKGQGSDSSRQRFSTILQNHAGWRCVTHAGPASTDDEKWIPRIKRGMTIKTIYRDCPDSWSYTGFPGTVEAFRFLLLAEWCRNGRLKS